MRSISFLNFDEIIPKRRIEEVIGRELTVHRFEDREILTVDPHALQQALQFTASCLIAKGQIEKLSKSVQAYHDKPQFAEKIENFFKANVKKKVPTKQILIQLRDGEFTHCSLHLADVVHGQWFLSDILLQKNHPIGNNNLKALNQGLGNGIFDLILRSIIQSARVNDINAFCLMAAHEAHKYIFEKRGFSTIPGPGLKIAEEYRMGYPMRLNLKNE